MPARSVEHTRSVTLYPHLVRLVERVAVFTLLLAMCHVGENAHAATWIDESPGCYQPFDLGGNCTYWNHWNPSEYDGEVTCLSHGRDLSSAKTFCWWNTRIMGHFTKMDDARAACKAAKRNLGSIYPCSREDYEGRPGRTLSYNKVNYRFQVHEQGCPQGMVESGNECIREAAHVSLNAGSCEVGNPVVGNPVHAGTGNKYQREVDLPRSGSAGGLSFARHYNSRPAALTGGEWRHTYLRTLKLRPMVIGQEGSGATRAIRGTIQMIRPDGRVILFYRTDEHDLAASDSEIPPGIPALGTDQYPVR